MLIRDWIPDAVAKLLVQFSVFCNHIVLNPFGRFQKKAFVRLKEISVRMSDFEIFKGSFHPSVQLCHSIRRVRDSVRYFDCSSSMCAPGWQSVVV
jgi:hypothetical protein